VAARDLRGDRLEQVPWRNERDDRTHERLRKNRLRPRDIRLLRVGGDEIVELAVTCAVPGEEARAERAASGNFRGNGVSVPSSSTQAAVTAMVMRAPTSASISKIAYHSVDDSSRYGPQRLIGGMYLSQSQLPGNGRRIGPTVSRVRP